MYAELEYYDNYTYHRLNLAGTIVPTAFHYRKTAELFGEYCIGTNTPYTGIRVPQYEMDLWKSYGLKVGPQFEFSCFTAVASDYIAFYNRCFVHAVAIRWHDQGYLLAAPSGEGKSTMTHALQEMYPGEFSVICGDRPILSIEEDEQIIIHPSPWNGKENWHGAPQSPLKGFICFSRGDENSIKQLPAKEAAVPVYTSLIQTRFDEQIINRFAECAEAIIQSVPVWKFVSAGVPESAEFLYDHYFKCQG